MVNKHLRQVIFSVMVSFLFLLAACSGIGNSNTPTGSNSGSTGTNQGTATQSSSSSTNQQVASPTVVTPASVSGSAGKAPIVITTPSPVAGGNATSQQSVLSDRTIVINDVSKQRGADATVTAVTIKVTVQNTGGGTIENQATFFQLIGTGGDFFAQTNSSDNFYGVIAAHSARSGTINFQMPTAAATSLRMMYRSEVPSEAVILQLKG